MTSWATETATFEQLVRLLGLGAEEPSADGPGGSAGASGAGGDESARAALAGCLQCPAPPDRRQAAEAMPALVTIMRRVLLPHTGRTLRDALLHADTPPEVLEAIKAQYKHAAASAEPGHAHASAVAIYYAAIASSLLFVGRKITSHSWSALADAFDDLAARPWMDGDLAAHFGRAADHCRGAKGGGRP